MVAKTFVDLKLKIFTWQSLEIFNALAIKQVFQKILKVF